MVWLCITADNRSLLLRCDDRQDSQSYQRVILTPALRFIRHNNPRYQGDSRVFQQDGAPSHVSVSTRNFLRAHRVTVLPWPPQSPDLNPVENCWAYISRQLVGRCFPTADSLWGAIQEVWQARPANLVPALYSSIPDRISAVLKAQGGHTQY